MARTPSPMQLVWPAAAYLGSYVDALSRGWSADNVRGEAAARDEGLAFVELTTDPVNIASQRVIEKNGGVLVERFVKPPQYGNAEGLRYRIALD